MSLTQEDREDRVRRRAHQLWQDAGMRDGEELRFWLQAEELEAAEEAKISTPASETFPCA